MTKSHIPIDLDEAYNLIYALYEMLKKMHINICLTFVDFFPHRHSLAGLRYFLVWLR